MLNDKMQGIFETIKKVIIGALPDSYVYFLLEDIINLDDLAMQILFECCKYAYDSTSKKSSLRSYMDSPELDDERMRYQRTVQKINDYRKKEYLMQKELSGIELDGLLPPKMEDIQDKIEGYQFNEFQYWEIKNVHDMRLVSSIADNRILSKNFTKELFTAGKKEQMFQLAVKEQASFGIEIDMEQDTVSFHFREGEEELQEFCDIGFPRHGERGEYSGETFYYAADNLRVKNMMDGIEMSISAENEEAYRSMILKAVQKQTEEQSTGMSQQM